MSTENFIVRDAEALHLAEGNTFFAANGEAEEGPAVSKNPGTHVRTTPGPGRSLHYPSLRGGSPKRRLNANRRMYDGEESDVTIVASACQKIGHFGRLPGWSKVGGTLGAR